MNCVYRFTYYSTARNNRDDLQLHHTRDADAFNELMPVLAAQGYHYGGLILNYPAKDQQAKTVRQVNLKFDASDLIVLTTRPPLSDDLDFDKRSIQRSWTSLEGQIFEVLGRYFQSCSRRRVVLSPELIDKLDRNKKKYAAIEYRINKKEELGGFYKFMLGRDVFNLSIQGVPQEKTATYLLYTKKTWRNGPGLLVSFGMRGTDGLLWNYLIRKKYPHLLNETQFVLSEMKAFTSPIEKIDSLAFADKFQVQTILQCPIP